MRSATTSTTNITGLRIICRGSSLAKAEPSAGHDDLAARGGRWLVSGHVWVPIRRSGRPSIARCSTTGPRARAGKKVRPPTIRMTPTSRPTKSPPWVGKVPADAGTRLLGRERAGDGERRDDDEEAPHQHRDPERQVVPGRVAGQPAEGRAVVRRRRGVGVEDLREAVRAGVGDRGDRVRQHDGDGGEAEHGERQRQDREHGHLDLARLDLLADVFRRAPDHQPGDEDRDEHEDQHAVEAGADAADDDLAELHVDERDHARRAAVKLSCMALTAPQEAAVVMTAKSADSADAEADLLALHVAAVDAERVDERVAVRLGPVGDGDAGDEQHAHRGEDRPALALVADHAAEDVGERGAEGEDRDHLQEVRDRASGSRTGARR